MSGADREVHVVVSELLADPHSAPDSTGEWFELENRTDSAIDLSGWILRSRNDPPHRIRGPLTLPARGRLVLGRSADRTVNGGAPIAYAYGNALALANGADWLVVASPDGRAADSVAWRRPVRGVAMGRVVAASPLASSWLTPDVDGDGWAPQEPAFGAGDRGTPGAVNVASRILRPTQIPQVAPAQPRSAGQLPHDSNSLIVRVLDVGQGEAILITSGRSQVLVDGGPDASRLGALLDSLRLNNTTFDLVIATHAHADHYLGLHALFESRRSIGIGVFAENLDHSSNRELERLRDSVQVRKVRGELDLRDTDDACATGRPVCTFELDGGARLHLLRPRPDAASPNDRSAIVKLVGPDSVAFSMWLAGDAEHDALRWMAEVALYGRTPGMDVEILKANHHGSCNGIDGSYLSRLTPQLVIFSAAARNDFGFVHTQTTSLLRSRGIPWYRTDMNGTITIRVPYRGSYSVHPGRGAAGEIGPSDRPSTQRGC